MCCSYSLSYSVTLSRIISLNLFLLALTLRIILKLILTKRFRLSKLTSLFGASLRCPLKKKNQFLNKKEFDDNSSSRNFGDVKGRGDIYHPGLVCAYVGRLYQLVSTLSELGSIDSFHLLGRRIEENSSHGTDNTCVRK